MRDLLKAIVYMLLTIVSFAVLGGAAAYTLNQPTETLRRERVVFRVHRGEPLSIIAVHLKEQGLIKSPRLLRIASLVQGTEGSFKAGTYAIRRGATTFEIHELLVAGDQQLVKVTVPEGYTVSKIAQLLEEKGVVGAQAFVDASRSADLLGDLRIPAQSVEGYLFPDTYFFPEDFSPRYVIELMVENFMEQLRVAVPESEGWVPQKRHDHVILASIVEREYRVAEEAPLIASVFKNRLRYNIGLESCATIEYIITEEKGQPHPLFITAEDTSIDSEYNTYKWAGLPPGPICSPGRVALSAAFDTPETDYYYFVLRDGSAGTHYFSNDLGQHNLAKAYFLKNAVTHE